MFVSAKAIGILTTQDVCEYERKISADERIQPGFQELFDATSISESRIDSTGLERIAEQVKLNPNRSSRSKLAIVAGRGASFDRALYYQKLVYPHSQNVIVFHDTSTARTWLGV
jgi:hypothetical protein